jgi:AcrR family transcriptional regulator
MTEAEIIKRVSELYLKYGIKSITMDDASRELGISKKTLYEYFKDKDDLVTQFVGHHMQKMHEEMMKLQTSQVNAIEELLIVSKFITHYLQKISPSVTYDLQKYYPEIWKNINFLQRDHIFKRIRENMVRGIKEGLYRNDLNIDIIANFYLFRMEMSQTFDLIVESKYSYEELFNTSFNYHIRGIANQKGIDYLECKLKHKA